MSFDRLLAQMTVRDLDRSIDWYTRLFGRRPDARPMTGLLEWHLAPEFGVQVWVEADRAGRSSMVLDATDLDAEAERLVRAGIPHDGVQDATSVRVLPLLDPDGNRVVLTAPLEPDRPQA